MSTTRGFSVRIFVPSGEPEGLRLVEKSNWTGRGLVFSRSLYGEARARPEVQRTGVYVLWGPSESSPLPRVYVGEGDPVLPRLIGHQKEKSFWTHALVFTSKDENLNKAHVQHLESRLVALAREAKRCELDNGNVPQPPSLSEADVADAEGFLADLLLCLPVVGMTLFEKPRASVAVKARELFLRSKGIEARGFEGGEGFVVLAGSTAAAKEVPSMPPYLSAIRRALLGNGALVDSGAVYRLTQDYTFDSPSSASGVMLGRSSNGRVDWKDTAGRSLKEIQETGSEVP